MHEESRFEAVEYFNLKGQWCIQSFLGDTELSRGFVDDCDAPRSSEDLVLKHGKNSDEIYINR